MDPARSRAYSNVFISVTRQGGTKLSCVHRYQTTNAHRARRHRLHRAAADSTSPPALSATLPRHRHRMILEVTGDLTVLLSLI